MKTLPAILAASFLASSLISCGGDESASRITFSAGTEIFEYNNSEQLYQLPFSLIVTDTQGRAVAGQKVSLSVVPLQYFKGIYVAGGTEWDTQISDTCNREDVNQNGILEAGEDINGNGILDPTNPAVIGPHPTLTPTVTNTSDVVTDTQGTGHFSLIYPKGEANWVSVRITATTSVTGTESAETMSFILVASQEDMDSIDTLPPSGSISSKYGVNLCTDPD